MNVPRSIAVLLALLTVGCSSSATTAPTTSPTTGPTTAPTTGPNEIVNVWTNPGSVALTGLPVGDGNVSTSAAATGSVFACQAGDPNAGGSQVDGPWIHGSVWDYTAKIHVEGAVSWPSATFSMTTDATTRTIVTNDLPDRQVTGVFPIAATDPAYAYDRNPNGIASQQTTLTLPIVPAAASAPSCLGSGPIGVLANGVFLYNALDGPGRDAVAHEAQDVCDGHPSMGDIYHYHEVPGCIRDSTSGESTIVGWAFDGYPIVVERDAAGNLPNNADLDECHGRTSAVLVDGSITTTYHYSATLEYPYTVGCFHGTQAARVGR